MYLCTASTRNVATAALAIPDIASDLFGACLPYEIMKMSAKLLLIIILILYYCHSFCLLFLFPYLLPECVQKDTDKQSTSILLFISVLATLKFPYSYFNYY